MGPQIVLALLQRCSACAILTCTNCKCYLGGLKWSLRSCSKSGASNGLWSRGPPLLVVSFANAPKKHMITSIDTWLASGATLTSKNHRFSRAPGLINRQHCIVRERESSFQRFICKCNTRVDWSISPMSGMYTTNWWIASFEIKGLPAKTFYSSNIHWF